MSFVICEPCVGTEDRSCVEACPVGAIHEAEDQLVISAPQCIGCGACVPACPVSAIFRIDRVPTEWEPFVEKNRRLAPQTPSPSVGGMGH